MRRAKSQANGNIRWYRAVHVAGEPDQATITERWIAQHDSKHTA
jgi:hypothetical protein